MEVLVIIGRGNQDFHVTRILRPVFLLDTQIMTDVKRHVDIHCILVLLYVRTLYISFGEIYRVIHHIQKLLGPIIDILCFIFFVISLIGASGLYVYVATYIHSNILYAVTVVSQKTFNCRLKSMYYAFNMYFLIILSGNSFIVSDHSHCAYNSSTIDYVLCIRFCFIV